jgi:hypothetical protein
MNVRACSMAAAIIFMGGCATSPPPVPTPKVAATPAVTEAPEAPAAFDSRRAHVDRVAAELGYHVEKRDKHRYFCRTAAPLGTRLEQKECMSEETMTDAVRLMEQNRNSWQQPKVCQGKDCFVK